MSDAKRPVYLLSFSDIQDPEDGPTVHVLEDAEIWAWISNEVDAPPPALVALAEAAGEDAHDLEADPQSGSYEMDKAHSVAGLCPEIGSSYTDIAAWLAKANAEVAGEYHGIYY
jgi:hypothetical protein